MTDSGSTPTQPEKDQKEQAGADQTVKVKGLSFEQRATGLFVTVIVTGVVSIFFIRLLPVLTLPEFFEKVDPATVDPAKEGLRIVLTSSSLWFVAIGGVLALISFSAAALDLAPGTRKSFVFNQLFAVASAMLILCGGVFFVVKG